MFELHRLSAISALVACFGVLGCGEQPKEAADETVTPAVAGPAETFWKLILSSQSAKL